MLVDVKYSGKKEPFQFINETFISKSLNWPKRGSVIQAPREDAELLVRDSPYDFSIVGPAEVLPPPGPPAPMVDEIPYLSMDGVDGTGPEPVVPEIIVRRPPGRPPKKAPQDDIS